MPNWRFHTNAFVSLVSAVMTIALLSHYQERLNIPQAIRGHIVFGWKMDAQKDGKELLKNWPVSSELTLSTLISN